MTASSILVGYDGSPHSEDALALARVMSAATGAQIVLGRIVPSEPLALSAVPVPLPELSAHFEEQRRVVRAALRYLQRRPAPRRMIRFDVMTVLGRGPAAVIEHLPGAFDAGM